MSQMRFSKSWGGEMQFDFEEPQVLDQMGV
jgi:hypothetical protein